MNEEQLTAADNTESDSVIEQYEKKIYDLKQLLDVSRSLCSTVEFSKLVESILYTCMGQFRVLGAGLFVLDALDSEFYELGKNINGLEMNSGVDYKINYKDPLISVLSKNNGVFTLEELQKIAPDGSNILPISSLSPSLVVPLIQKNNLNGILLLGERITMNGDENFSDYEKELILMMSSLAAIAVSNATLYERSSTDMMTRLKLKYFFYNVLSNKLEQAVSQGLCFSVLMFDIDFFKRFNDTYGHACGDYVLQTVAKIVQSCIRSRDLASRYGGEEFTVLLDWTSKNDAMTVAERIREKIEQYDFCYENQHVKVTVSLGVTEFNPKTNSVTMPKLLVDQADQALYVSKRTGRNKVTFADKKLIAEVKIPD